MKRVLSFLLVLVMIFAMLPYISYANLCAYGAHNNVGACKTAVINISGP